MLKNKKNSGFTLIELLVVIAIISLLSSIVLSNLNNARAKARDSKRMFEKKQVITALNLFYDNNGRYPMSASGGAGFSCLAPGSEKCWRDAYSGLDTLVTDLAPYISAFPKNDAPSGVYANDRLIYVNNYPGGLAGQFGAFLVWVKENSMTTTECPSNYGYTHTDSYWYCYEYIGK